MGMRRLILDQFLGDMQFGNGALVDQLVIGQNDERRGVESRQPLKQSTVEEGDSGPMAAYLNFRPDCSTIERKTSRNRVVGILLRYLAKSLR